ncbi:MAG: ion transporter [Bacteroidota bacterium]|jgi:inward rectifier potassium channel|nr:ion transporter [Bacteroidota bacterium]
MAIRKSKKENELGFGSKTSSQRSRLINKDGSFNVDRIELSSWSSTSMYHSLIRMRWAKFNAIVFVYFISINLLFACLYYFSDIEGLKGMEAVTERDKFLEAFFFSSQTLSTVGFGRLSPGSNMISTIATIESLVGLLGFALATGLLYARFSRPLARILYSKNAIIAPFRDGKAFQFRIANKMSNSQITEMNCRVTVAKLEEENGVLIRRFRPLELEIPNILFFPMTWTINHPIDENSPLFGMSSEDMAKADVEFLISLNGFDDTFSQNVSTRYSYTHEELVYGAKWISVFSTNEQGQTSQDLRKISDYQAAKLE